MSPDLFDPAARAWRAVLAVLAILAGFVLGLMLARATRDDDDPRIGKLAPDADLGDDGDTLPKVLRNGVVRKKRGQAARDRAAATTVDDPAPAAPAAGGAP